jgi:hypothetical protein
LIDPVRSGQVSARAQWKKEFDASSGRAYYVNRRAAPLYYRHGHDPRLGNQRGCLHGRKAQTTIPAPLRPPRRALAE